MREVTCCPTWIACGDPTRTALPKGFPTASRPGLFHLSAQENKFSSLPNEKGPTLSCGAFVARPGFEPRQTEPKSVVLPLYYRAIRPHKPAETGKKECKNKLWQSMFQKNFQETSPAPVSTKAPPAQGCRRENSHPPLRKQQQPPRPQAPAAQLRQT
jgi:hypothetical protein